VAEYFRDQEGQDGEFPRAFGMNYAICCDNGGLGVSDQATNHSHPGKDITNKETGELCTATFLSSKMFIIAVNVAS